MKYNFPAEQFKTIMTCGIVLIFVMVYSGCSTTLNIDRRAPYLTSSNCYISGEKFDWSTYPATYTKASAQNLRRLKLFSENSLYLAYSMHIDSLLEELYLTSNAYRKSHDQELREKFNNIRRKISDKITLQNLDVSSLKAELDCEEERARQVGMYVQDKVNKKEKTYTIAGIISGAAIGVLASSIGLSDGDSKLPDILGVIGGAGGAALGLKALAANTKVNFMHNRNHLADVWDGRDTARYFSPSIWFYLNNPKEGANGESLRLQMISKWMAFDQIADVKSTDRQRQIDLYFGAGGNYTADELVMRARMLQQLETTVMLITQDLRGLLEEVYKIDIT